MQNRLALAALSVIGGAVIAVASHPVWHQSVSVGSEEEGVELITDTDFKSEAAAETDEVAAERIKPVPDHLVMADNTETDEVKPEIVATTEPVTAASTYSYGQEMPEAYATMVTPRPRPERLTTQELYQSFVDDSRDESWAYPMELGINQYISERGGDLGAVFEFVECRSSYCTIAGVVYGGGQPVVNEFLAEMTQRGWWQTSGSNSTVGTRADTEYRFVSIFPRTPEDSSRSDSTGQSDGQK